MRDSLHLVVMRARYPDEYVYVLIPPYTSTDALHLSYSAIGKPRIIDRAG